MKKIVVLVLFIAVICSFAVVPTVSGESVDGYYSRPYEIMKDFVTKHPLRKAGSEGEKEAGEYIKSFFQSLKEEGDILETVEEQEFSYQITVSSDFYRDVVDEKDSKNVIYRINSTADTADTVIIGAHYDNYFSDGNGQGAYDNGSGVGIMLALAEEMQGKSLPYNLVFVAFGAGEDAVQGSMHFVKEMKGSEKNSVLLYVNLDSILAGDNLYVYAEEVVTVQEDYYVSLADKLGIDLHRPPLNKGVYHATITKYGYAHAGLASDNISFVNQSIPTVSFSAHNWSAYTLGLMDESDVNENVTGTEKDRVDEIETLYGQDGKNKMSDVYALVKRSLVEEDFVSSMQRARMETPEYTLLNEPRIVTGICAVFLLIVASGFIILYKNYKKKYTEERADEDGQNGNTPPEPPRVFEDFD